MNMIKKIISLILTIGITASPLYAAGTVNAGREEIIDMTINSLMGGNEQPTRLEPLKIKIQEIFRENEYMMARALHLYNQRRLSDAKGDLKEILISQPQNTTAAKYISAANSKIEAAQKPKEVLEEEEKGIVSVERAQMGGISGKEEFGNTDGEQKFTTNTAVIAAKTNRQGSDLPAKYMAEGMKLEGTISDYKYTATATANYYNIDNVRENKRLNNATWWMKNEKVRFIAGDTSSYLSRYILNGVNYRGVNFKMDLYQNMLNGVNDNITLLYGKIPFFYLTEDEYIYPREIVGVRNEMDIGDNWDVNTTFAYIWDNFARLQKIDTNDKEKENGLFGIDQVFRVIPNVWTLSDELAFSYADDNRHSGDKLLRSFAHYFVSDIKTKTVKFYNSYERVDPSFRSFVGLSGFTANKQVTIGREHFLNFVEFDPYDEVHLNLQYSKTLTNLNKLYDVETLKENNYKANLKIMPSNDLPRFSLRGSIWTSNSTPGAVNAPKDESGWDSSFEMAKKLWDTDFSTSYGLRGYSQFINDSGSYGDALEHTFSLSANKRFFDRMELTPSYTLARAYLRKRPDMPISTKAVTNHLFDLSLSSQLWDTAMFTFDYNISSMEDFATPSVWGTNNSFTTTFSWPFTTNLGFRKKFVFSPYLSYHYSAGTSTILDRNYFAGKLDGDYFLTDNTKLNLSGEYRENSVSDPTYVGFGDEYRIMLTYKTVNGF